MGVELSRGAVWQIRNKLVLDDADMSGGDQHEASNFSAAIRSADVPARDESKEDGALGRGAVRALGYIAGDAVALEARREGASA
jgi:hypothetical protein